MIVNLINHTKAEGVLQRAFHSLCKESGIDGIYYDAFDFHQGELIPNSFIFIYKFIVYPTIAQIISNNFLYYHLRMLKVSLG